jgi:hypothetical protein
MTPVRIHRVNILGELLQAVAKVVEWELSSGIAETCGGNVID